MTIFDYAVIIIIGISLIVSIMRGLVQEVLSIVGWFAAIYVSKTYANQVTPFIPDSIPGDNLKLLTAFIILFVATLFLSSLISMAISSIFSTVGLGWLNNVLGAFFGVGRGVLIVSVIVFLAGLTSIPKDPRWQNAILSAPCEAIVLSVLEYAPDFIKDKVSYDRLDTLGT